MIMKRAWRRCGVATTPSTQLEVRKRSETDAESAPMPANMSSPWPPAAPACCKFLTMSLSLEKSVSPAAGSAATGASLSLFFRRLTQGFWAAARLLRASTAKHRRAMMLAAVSWIAGCKGPRALLRTRDNVRCALAAVDVAQLRCSSPAAKRSSRPRGCETSRRRRRRRPNTSRWRLISTRGGRVGPWRTATRDPRRGDRRHQGEHWSHARRCRRGTQTGLPGAVVEAASG